MRQWVGDVVQATRTHHNGQVTLSLIPNNHVTWIFHTRSRKTWILYTRSRQLENMDILPQKLDLATHHRIIPCLNLFKISRKNITIALLPIYSPCWQYKYGGSCLPHTQDAFPGRLLHLVLHKQGTEISDIINVITFQLSLFDYLLMCYLIQKSVLKSTNHNGFHFGNIYVNNVSLKREMQVYNNAVSKKCIARAVMNDVFTTLIQYVNQT